MVKCFCCSYSHPISKCKVSKEGLHFWVIKECINENMNLLYFHNNHNVISFQQKINCFSLKQCKQLLNDYRCISRFVLIKRVYKKYKKLSTNLLKFHIDYPSFQERLSVDFNRTEQEKIDIIDIEKQLSYIMLEMQYLNNGDVYSYIQNIPNYINDFISIRYNRSLVIEPSSPTHPPPSYDILDITCDAFSFESHDFHCCICDENLTSDKNASFSCKHIFCVSCVTKYLTIIKQLPTCPLCRSSVNNIFLSNKENKEKMENILKKIVKFS